MATATYIPIETYLSTSYEPDMDYVDGELEDRNVGEYDHNMAQQMILFWFVQHGREWAIRGVQEQRTRLNVSTVRIPDVSLFSRKTPIEQVFTRPPLVAIEVLSPEDRHARMDRKIRHYIEFGVLNVWIIDPKMRCGWNSSTGDWVRTSRFTVADTPIYLDLSELFAKIDEENA